MVCRAGSQREEAGQGREESRPGQAAVGGAVPEESMAPEAEAGWRWERASNGVPLLAWDVGPAHARVSCREGGTSPEPWDSLNVGFHVGDRPERVRANRLRLFDAIGTRPERVVWAQQVHGAEVAWVGYPDGGKGSLSPEDSFPGVDGLITDVPGLILAMGFADCVPVALADPKRGRLALCHAGWRGTASGVVVRAVHELERSGSPPEADIRVAIGPAIGSSYAVDEHVMGPMRARYPWADEHFDRVTGVLDLVAVTVHILRDAGIPAQHLAVTEERTESSRFFSHRTQHGKTGRMAALAWLAS